MGNSLWFTTRSALFRPGDHVWNEVARYAEPLRRLLALRYRAWVNDADREDLVQDILLEMKETLVELYEPTRGRFRALIQEVTRRRVIDRLRKHRPASLEADAPIPAPDPAEVEALDLEAGLLDAVAACREHFTQARDLDVVWTLSDRLVKGLKSAEIARLSGATARQISHRLEKARAVIFTHLLARELELSVDDARLPGAVEAFRRSLRTPRQTLDHMAQVGDPGLREQLETFLQRFRVTLPLFRGDDSQRGRELAQGIQVIFDEAAAA